MVVVVDVVDVVVVDVVVVVSMTGIVVVAADVSGTSSAGLGPVDVTPTEASVMDSSPPLPAHDAPTSDRTTNAAEADPGRFKNMMRTY